MTVKIPQNVKYILNHLNNNGYEAYIVGGSVRDSLLGVEPKDWDFTTNATPDTIELLFNKTIPTGKDHGTITVMINDIGYEITTYRLECDYDGRRPKVVRFTDNLKDDLARRDFTINAMAMDIEGNIIDYFNGKEDLIFEVIRFVGNAEERIKEDKLRVLRAVRFANRYGFEIDESDLSTIRYNNIIKGLSEERIREELNKILLCNEPSCGLKLLAELGILNQIIPEFIKCYDFEQNNPHHAWDVFNHILNVVDNTESKLELRLSALFHDIGKPNTYSEDENGVGHFYGHHKESAKICREVMTRLKYSNKEIEYVSELVYFHMTRYKKLRPSSIKKFINNVGVEKLDDLFKLFIADRVASNPPYDLEDIYKLKFECERIINEKQPLSVKDLAINGNDLIKLGIPQGKEIGKILNILLDKVLEDESLNTEASLISILLDSEYKIYKSE